MAVLTVTSRGQVTFRKDVLQHLGIEAGEKIEIDLLPGGRAALRAARPSGSIDDFLGILAGKTTVVATVDELNDAGGARLGWPGMNLVVDTNILVRAAVRDDPNQARIADAVLKDAAVIAVTVPCLCEFARVLRSVYGFERRDVALAMRALSTAANVAMNRPAVDAGLAFLDAGGDFADGVIAHEGEWLGGTEFASFDRKAVALLTAQGRAARLL